MLTHRPFGIEHPYATSADQRVPVRPEMGEPVRLGVIAAPEVRAVVCEWRPDGAPPLSLPLTPAVVDAGAAAALAGGEGHLAAAQAAALDDDGAWSVVSPPVTGPVRYRFRAEADGGASEESDWFDLQPVTWVTGAGDLTFSGGGNGTGGGRASGAGADRLLPGSVQWLRDETGVHRVRFALALEPDEHVVGFGERFDAVDQRGRTLDAVVFEQYKGQAAAGRTYLPMPFAHVVSPSDSWGFHLRTSRRSWFDVGASTPDALVIEVDLGGEPHEHLDVGVYTGDPAAVVAAFTAEVGRAQELPDWVFRLWASGNEWNTRDLVMDRMDTHASLDIPVGVVVIEAWSDEQGIMLFRDATYPLHPDGAPHTGAEIGYPAGGAWPDPRAMVAELHERGVKVILWQIPLLKTSHDLGPDVPADAQVYADGRALIDGGHAVLEADGTPYHNRGWWFPQSLMPDLSTQHTREWWTAKRDYLLADLDVDGFKTDGGEHAWGHDLRYGDGTRGDEGNNRYPVHYARAFGDLLRRHGKAPVTFSRAGFTGSQAHGIHWAGDEDSTWEAFRASVTAGITASACGIVYWGWDLAGFSGPPPDAELYLRAAAASAFMPIMQYHSEFNHHRRPMRDRTPWYVAEVNGDPEVVEEFRRLAHLRERLVPYLTAQARVAIETGRPLMRGLFFDHADDEEIWRWPLQFGLGDDLLVHPVTDPGAATWATYLPAGDWVDAWTGEAHHGRATHTREVPPAVVPVYVRAAAWPRLAPVFEGAAS
ncbi:glycoside hydrolase family 31 [Occultella glacieicola]|uniref:Glycoside hydrolase family 31 n=1 Tax=Occultella glacieicola TaxID=2518684 RepID=A0ABY2DZV9_9MICO|nr:glycoside hydrolase family 31 [Occultella glacieicola]